MIITKTKFLNYTRCNKYIELEKLYNNKIYSEMTLEEYLKEHNDEKKREVLNSMFKINETEEKDNINKENIQLDALMEYYKEIEVIASNLFTEKFGGHTIFDLDTKNQKMIEFKTKENKYLCYVDIFNENNEVKNIVEVKATTSKKFLETIYKTKDNEYNLFKKKNTGIYSINYPINDEIEFNKKYEKLKNRYDNCGKYIYDLAVQRYFNEKSNIKEKTNYYLAVLNHEYVYDGYKKDGKRVYNKDINGNEIIIFIELNKITEELLKVIDLEIKKLESNIKTENNTNTIFGEYCMLNSNTECAYKEICYKNVPKYNTSFNFLSFQNLTDENGKKYNKFDLLNNNILKMQDVPKHWIHNTNHIIQYESLINEKEYINKNKIKDILKAIKYPIYHLDFEAFPCPLPRFKGEKCYSHSVFEFSLHIEKEPNNCDEIKDNIVFLADDFEDEREKLIKCLLENIDTSKGTMLAQNISYEVGRIKELADIFPKYKEELLKINNMSFDLLYILRNNKNYYLNLGYSKEDAEVINYYHQDLSGSYSIKKTLPILVPNLSYQDLEVKNGTEALVEYSKYNYVSNNELIKIKNNLIIYCRQDTWAMVEILRKLREKIK